MAAPIIGVPKYYSGSAGTTVSLAAGETLLGLWVVATGSSGTVTVDGGSTITLIQNVPFSFAVESGTAEWTGVDIVLANVASYFIKTVTKF